MLLCSLACLAERSNSWVMWCRRLCVSAGHVDPWHLLAPDQQIPAEGHRDEDEDKENNSRMTFGKFVNSFFFYCDNPSKFAEKRLDRDRHMSELRQCLREVIRDEVSCASQRLIVRMFAVIMSQRKQTYSFTEARLEGIYLEHETHVRLRS